MHARLIAWAVVIPALLLTACSREKAVGAGQEPARPDPPAGPVVSVACLGRLEARSDVVEVGAAVDGVVSAVHVVEGQRVERGQPLAEIGCADLRAAVPEAEAVAESTRQIKARLLRGSRDEERAAAAERASQAFAEWKRASSDLARFKQLAAQDDISAAALGQAQRDYDVTEARYREALRREELVKAPALPEEIAKADADIRSAELRREILGERIAKCSVTAPMEGTVIRVLTRQGESFSTVAPRPLLQMADLSVLRVRAEIDERDVLKVHVGQKALVFPEGKREEALPGLLTSIYKSLGRKRVVTDDPSDKTDREVLEALVEFDRTPPRWPLGLRVVVQLFE